MFKILDGRDSFYQFDLDRKLIVEDQTIQKVHFCNGSSDCALVAEVYTENGLRLANVPNVILQQSLKVKVYGYDSNYTKYEDCFVVNKRNKPADYIYTDEEVKTWEMLADAIEEHRNNYENPHSVAAHQVQGLASEFNAMLTNAMNTQIEPLVEDSIQEAIYDSWEAAV